MTQTVDSKAWSALIQMQPLNFLDMVAPPDRIGREELLARMIRLFKEEDEAVLPVQGWLATDVNAFESVLRGLSQEGRIDRGSFSAYAD